MNQLPLLSKEINDIYFIANSPSSFYKMMRENYFIQIKLSVLPTEFLIEEFYKRAKEPVNSSSDIANIYAIFISLTFKEPTEVQSFFKESLNIKFEWFSEIAKYYLQNPTPIVSYQSIAIQQNKINNNIDNAIITPINNINLQEINFKS